MTDLGIDRVLERVARARELLARLAAMDAFHARALAELLVPWWDAAASSLTAIWGVQDQDGPDRNAERAQLRASLRDRAESLACREDAPVLDSLEDILREERLGAERSCHELERACGSARPPALEDVVRRGVLVLAARMSAVLEPRIAAEQTIDGARAEALHAERERWIELARGIAGAVTGARRWRAGREDDAIPPRLRPLARRVLLVVARDPGLLARVSAILEDAGATTILADSRSASIALLRWFEVDGVVSAIDGERDPCLGLPRAISGTGRAAPLFLGLLTGRAQSAAELAASSGYDAAIPMSAADAEALALTIGVALDARRASRLAR